MQIEYGKYIVLLQTQGLFKEEKASGDRTLH